ncbi:MAG: hypothetical protein ABJ308_03990 [Halieaceae bacterium]
MNEYLFLKFLHVLAFVYWLGGDLGTFLASRQVVREDLGAEARATALKIMLACDQGPKTAMPLIFPLGLQMAQSSGLTQLPAWLMLVIWLLALVWAGIVQYLFFSQDPAARARVGRIDFGLRLAVIVAIVISAGAALLGYHWVAAGWMVWKMLIFAAMVGCGLLIRIKLKPFVAAFAQLMSAGASPAVNQAMQQALARVRPWVWMIWLGLFVNAALGLHLL